MGVHSLLPFQLGLPRSAECFSRIFGKKRFSVRFRHSIFCCRAGPIFFREFSIKRFSVAFTVPFFIAAQCRFFSRIFEQNKKGFSSALIIPVFLAAPNFFREFFSSPHVSLSRSAELFSRIFDKMVFFCSCHSNFCYHVVPIFVDNIRKKRKGFSSALIIPLFFCHAQRRIFFENFCKNLKSYFVRFHLSICCWCAVPIFFREFSEKMVSPSLLPGPFHFLFLRSAERSSTIFKEQVFRSPFSFYFFIAAQCRIFFDNFRRRSAELFSRISGQKAFFIAARS